MVKYLRVALALILVVLIILSYTVVGNKLTDPATYSHSMEVLDGNRTTVLALAAASAAASTAVSSMPDDTGSPISEELSEFTTWFMVILAVIYLEKYLLTIFGAAACYILFPLGFCVLLVNFFLNRSNLKAIGTRLVTFGIVLMLIIPTSVWVSDHIRNTYAESIEMTIQSASAAGNNVLAETDDEDKDSSKGLRSILNNVGDSVAGILEQFKNLVNRFIEATAVMLVTTCLIPILVVIFLIWIMRTLFNVPIVVPTQLMKPKKHRRSYDNEDERELALTR